MHNGILKYIQTGKLANTLWYINTVQEIYVLRFQKYNTVILLGTTLRENYKNCINNIICYVRLVL